MCLLYKEVKLIKVYNNIYCGGSVHLICVRGGIISVVAALVCSRRINLFFLSRIATS